MTGHAANSLSEVSFVLEVLHNADAPQTFGMGFDRPECVLVGSFVAAVDRRRLQDGFVDFGHVHIGNEVSVGIRTRPLWREVGTVPGQVGGIGPPNVRMCIDQSHTIGVGGQICIAVARCQCTVSIPG